MAEDERMNDDITDADRGGGKLEGGANREGGVGAASGAELRGGDPASTGEGGQSRGDEGEGAGRSGDWDPGLIRGGGELY